MNHPAQIVDGPLATVVFVVLSCATMSAQVPADAAEPKVVIPFDFESKFDQGRYGQMLGDMIWKKLERRGGFVIPEAMLDVREWSERTNTIPSPETSLDHMKTIVQDTFGGDIAIWGKLERLPDVQWDQYDLWIKIVDFSSSPPEEIAQIKARTKTVSEIPHVYVKQALDRLYGTENAVAETGPGEDAEEQWKTGSNLVEGDFETTQGWGKPAGHVERQGERSGQGNNNHFIRFNIPHDVAVTSGVLYYSDYFPIEEGAMYRFQCRWRSSGPSPKVFIKCYADLPTRFSERANGEAKQTEKREVYRSQQNLKGPGNVWNTHTESFTPKHTQYEPRFGRVMLYGYLRQGTLDWDDVIVKQIVPPAESDRPKIRRPSLETKVRSEELERINKQIGNGRM